MTYTTFVLYTSERKTYFINACFLAIGNFFVIGETFVDGQNRGVWCRSKKPITDMRMYENGVVPVALSTPTWLLLQYLAAGSNLYAGTDPNIFYGKLTLFDWFLCEY
jgi:hypothetical protein